METEKYEEMLINNITKEDKKAKKDDVKILDKEDKAITEEL